MAKGIYKFVCLIALPLCIVGCNFDKKEKAQALDTQIGRINDTLLVHAKHWGDELKIAINTLDFSQLEPARMRMQNYIDEKIEVMENVEHVGGSEALVNAELEYLNVERSIAADHFSTFEQFTDSVTMTELEDAYIAVEKGTEKEQEIIKRLHQLREEYAEKNDFPKYVEK